MALKAGRVGVDKSEVDIHGKIILKTPTDVYTKTQADNKFVNKNQLKANDKNFYFAYDETSGKYGYKLGATGDFNPFSNGGGSLWNVPEDLPPFSVIGSSLAPEIEVISDNSKIDYSKNLLYIDLDINVGSAYTSGDFITISPMTFTEDSLLIFCKSQDGEIVNMAIAEQANRNKNYINQPPYLDRNTTYKCIGVMAVSGLG